MPLFTKDIRNWDDWGRIFQDMEAFTPLVRTIYERERLPYQPPERCKPGTNAVFAVGETVIKLFVPIEAGYDAADDCRAELCGLSRAEALGVAAPKRIAAGEYADRYRWRYLITSRVLGTEYGDLTLTEKQRYQIGRALRRMTDTLNVPEKTSPDFLEKARKNRAWEEKGFPASFFAERMAFLDAYPLPPFVYCHADITPENLFVAPDGGLTLIDFADAHPAPQVCEHAIVAAELFRFDRAGLAGYFGDEFDREELAAICMDGLLVHDFGANVLSDRFGADFADFGALRRHLISAISME
ncbi:MAG: aminoglycoside phosphotransferase family protein [Clostridiaceae bacterium]|nr:aminoglycoside phosphotransferase family protein [Clostridiaceae bacterium]